MALKTPSTSLIAVLAIAGAVLSGCATAHGPKTTAQDASDKQFDTFGRAVRQDIVAQIADPDPAWKASPAPGTNGKRLAGTMSTYTGQGGSGGGGGGLFGGLFGN